MRRTARHSGCGGMEGKTRLEAKGKAEREGGGAMTSHHTEQGRKRKAGREGGGAMTSHHTEQGREKEGGRKAGVR